VLMVEFKYVLFGSIVFVVGDGTVFEFESLELILDCCRGEVCGMKDGGLIFDVVDVVEGFEEEVFVVRVVFET
jgi:hypothetical protein